MHGDGDGKGFCRRVGADAGERAGARVNGVGPQARDIAYHRRIQVVARRMQSHGAQHGGANQRRTDAAQRAGCRVDGVGRDPVTRGYIAKLARRVNRHGNRLNARRHRARAGQGTSRSIDGIGRDVGRAKVHHISKPAGGVNGD